MVASASKLKRSPGPRTAQKMLGSEVPRIWTPPLRELTPETSLGFAAVDFAREVCGMDLFPWQRWLLIHALELAGDLRVTMNAFGQLVMPDRDPMDPLFRFRRVVVLVARQNGKSTLSQALSLFFLYVLGVDLILGTAQDLDTAEEVWDAVLDTIEETPDLAELADRPVKVNGKKTIRLKTGERYKVKAANRRAGRGLSGDLILLDELREHQSWDAWAAITKTTQARPSAMIWALSNAGDMSSVVLRTLRMMAHNELGDPDGINAAAAANLLPTGDEISEMVDLTDADDAAEPEVAPEDMVGEASTLGIFEWSAPPGCSVMDPAGWQWANPSLGHGISRQTIAGDASTEGKSPETEWVFRTEVLCQWPDGAMRGPFAPGSWERQLVKDEADAEVRRARLVSAKRAMCVHVSHDRSRAYIAAAGENVLGETVVSVVQSGLGVAWVRPWLEENADRILSVTGQGRGSWVSDLINEWEADPTFRLPLVPWAGAELVAAFGQAFDALRDGTVWHTDQPILDTAAALAKKKDLGGGWVIDDRGSKCDTAPLNAWIGALWLWRRPKKAAPPPPLASRIIRGKPDKQATASRPGADQTADNADLATINF